MLLKGVGIAAAIVAALLGLLIYASPRQSDQLAGKLIMAGGVAMIALALFVDRPWVRGLLLATVTGVAAFTVYVLLKWSGRL